MQSEGGCNILVFAGTTEGRQIARVLEERREKAYVSVATEYGKCLLEDLEHLQILQGRMDEEQMKEFIESRGIDLVVDATHPFAVLVTENIRRACERAGIPCLRCLRKDSRMAEGARDSGRGDGRVIRTGSVAQAVEYLKGTEGNILIATGSKELHLYTQMEDFRKRCYARVLSVKESVDRAIGLGFQGEHLIAMQGPFSRELNAAMLRHTKASWFVTKDSGEIGGFQEKLEAAAETGAGLVVVGRPEEEGFSPEEICRYLQGDT